MKLVDTSVAIDHLRGFTPATELLDSLLAERVPLVSSEVVRFELLAGVRAGDEEWLEAFCFAVDWIPVTERIARNAAALARQYRGSHRGIDTADYLIAATAALLNAGLLTRNVRHFPMVADLQPPY